MGDIPCSAHDPCLDDNCNFQPTSAGCCAIFSSMYEAPGGYSQFLCSVAPSIMSTKDNEIYGYINDARQTSTELALSVCRLANEVCTLQQLECTRSASLCRDLVHSSAVAPRPDAKLVTE